MRKYIYSLIIIIFGCSSTCVVAQTVNFSDIKFKNKLLTLSYVNTNGDGEIQVSEARAALVINVRDSQISDLRGIEEFVNLEVLYADDNNIQQVDLSQNTRLKELYISKNDLYALDVRYNTSLIHLDCYGNNLVSLNVRYNTKLESLSIYANNLTSIDVVNNPQLKSLFTWGIEDLYLGGITSLVNLNINNAKITTLDLSKQTNLKHFFAVGSSLEHVNLANGNNHNIESIGINTSPNLLCVQVDDVSYSNANWTQKDDHTVYTTEDCEALLCEVEIPDPVFKAYLLNNTAINTNGNEVIECTEAESFEGTINVNNKNISSIEGIKSFINLKELHCNYNQLQEIALGKLTKLEVLSCNSNKLTTLKLGNATNLEKIFCHSNKLTSFNITKQKKLIELKAHNNDLEELDLSKNTKLEVFWVHINALDSLNLENNSALKSVSISLNPPLWYLNVANGENEKITPFDAVSVPNLSCVNVSNEAYANANWTNKDTQITYSTDCEAQACYITIPDPNFKAYLLENTAINTNGNAHIECSEAENFEGTINIANRAISSIEGIENFINLENLYCQNNELESITLGHLIKLQVLNCFNNNISTLDIRYATALKELTCRQNNLDTLVIKHNEQLTHLIARDNYLTELDLSQNTKLEVLRLNDNELDSLNLQHNSELKIVDVTNNTLLNYLNVANGNNEALTNFKAENVPNLSCVKVSNESFATANWTTVDEYLSFKENCESITAIEPVHIQSIQANPNPTTGLVSVNKEASAIDRFMVLNINGQVLLENENTSTIDISALQSGFYLISVISGEQVLNTSIVKQ